MCVHCGKVGQYFSNNLLNVVPIVNPTIYWAIFCQVVLVNVRTLLQTCIIFSYFDKHLGKDMTLQLPDYGSPLVGKILTSCWGKYETIGPIDAWVDFGKTLGNVLENIAQLFRSVPYQLSYHMNENSIYFEVKN